MYGNTANVWKYNEIKVDPGPLCTSCHISTMNKNYRSKTPMKPKTPFKWVFMETIPSIFSKSFTKYNTSGNYLLVMDAYSKIPKLYVMVNITTEEVMEKIDMF